ncbi:MAG: Polymer-forming cytoskeletal, partial [Blastocatellia bacterium]|nr:Polymer-forming cytoskeletal [Blastocatellia bacterium]
HWVVNGDIIAGQRIELGRAAKLSGNIQTPSLVIEQGAVFEGSCKMVQMKTASTPKVERKDNVIDASKLDAVKADASRKADEGTNSKSAATALAS